MCYGDGRGEGEGSLHMTTPHTDRDRTEDDWKDARLDSARRLFLKLIVVGMAGLGLA